MKLMLSNQATHNARTVTQLAGNAVRAGLPWQAALQAVTTTPARVFGRDDLGTIEVNARANLVVWSDDPFELSAKPTAVMIGGRIQPLESRQTLLRDRYRDLPGTPLAPMSLP